MAKQLPFEKTENFMTTISADKSDDGDPDGIMASLARNDSKKDKGTYVHRNDALAPGLMTLRQDDEPWLRQFGQWVKQKCNIRQITQSEMFRQWHLYV
jgi:hypothetical protein